MRWPVKAEITWVSNLLIGMMNSVSYMRNLISKKIYSRMESKRLDRRRKKSEWSTLSSRRDRDNLKSSENKFLKCQNWLKQLLISKRGLIERRRELSSSQRCLRTLQTILSGETLEVKTLTKRP
jgi:hypothetical protein